MNWLTKRLQAALDRKLAEIRKEVEWMRLCGEVPFSRRELEPVVERLGFEGARVVATRAQATCTEPDRSLRGVLRDAARPRRHSGAAMIDFKSPHFMPALIVVLYAVTSVRYAFAGEWGRVAYWVCAAGITISATWLVGSH